MIQELYLDVSRRNLNVSRRNLDVSRRKLNVSRKKLVQRVKKQEKTEAQFGNLKLAENCVIFKIKMIKIYVEKKKIFCMFPSSALILNGLSLL